MIDLLVGNSELGGHGSPGGVLQPLTGAQQYTGQRQLPGVRLRLPRSDGKSQHPGFRIAEPERDDIDRSMNASLQYPVSPAYMPTPLAAGGTYILCLRLTAGVGAVSGQTTNATFTFQAGAA